MSEPEQPDQPRHTGHSAQADRPEQPEAWGAPRSKVVTWYDQAATVAGVGRVTKPGPCRRPTKSHRGRGPFLPWPRRSCSI
jgi:hypothetical protein